MADRQFTSFEHSSQVWAEYPDLVPGVLLVDGIHRDVAVESAIEHFSDIARARLAATAESELPEIQAWRRAFSRMGLKPTQYRCAAESLLRRFRKEGALPRLHPLVDLCNAASLAFAIPVAALDRTRIGGELVVRHAVGDEEYLAFSGEIEHPQTGEVIFADADGRAHARRWTNRQSGYSAVRDSTQSAFIIVEAMHRTAPADVAKLVASLADEIARGWSVSAETALLNVANPRFP